ELRDLSDLLTHTEFKVFAGALAGGGVVRGINAGARELPRSELDALTELAKQHGAKGLVWAFVQEGAESWRSPVAKFLSSAEIGGGSIRNHRRDVQQRVFDLIGIDADEAEKRFGFLLDALRYGAPPHGGIAVGIDRTIALVAGRENIREVIAFPKSTSGADP